MKRIIKRILMVLGGVFLLFALFMGGMYAVYFVIPFRGEAFNESKWGVADSLKCGRGKMVADVEKTILQKGASRWPVEQVLGKPACERLPIVEYALGLCHPVLKDKYAMLRVQYGEGKVARSQVMWYKADSAQPSGAFPTFKEYNDPAKTERSRQDWLNHDGWVSGAQGMKYGINLANELVIRTPQDDLTFIANFQNGMGGISVFDVPSCK